jgi:hypothetical protein
MPKSRTRKDHKKKVQNRTNRIKSEKAKQEKEFMDIITKAQEEALKKRAESETVESVESVVEVEELGDIGDMKLD